MSDKINQLKYRMREIKEKRGCVCVRRRDRQTDSEFSEIVNIKYFTITKEEEEEEKAERSTCLLYTSRCV